jgi:hypothetical protein
MVKYRLDYIFDLATLNGISRLVTSAGFGSSLIYNARAF